MSYKLYIRDSNQVWHLLDMGNEKPAMNYQVNDIAELKDRQCDYSQSLRLPMSPGNCQKFGFAHIPDVDTDIPYRKHECRLFCNESVIAGKGSFLILERITDAFETQILSGNVDLFQSLANKKMSELDLGFVQFGMQDFGDQTENWVIPKLNLIKGEREWYDTTIGLAIPFAWLKNAIEKLLSGYDLITNLHDEDWETKAISIVALNPADDSFEPFECNASSSYYIAPNSGEKVIDFVIYDDGTGRLTENASHVLKYVCPVNCTLKIRVDVQLNTGYMVLRINNKSYWLDEVTSNPFSKEETITLNQGDEITFQLFARNYNGVMAGESSFTISEIVSSSLVPIGGRLHVSQNLGFETQLDFFKGFVQLFGMTVLVDNELKKVYAYTMNELYDNRSTASDWSDKLHMDKKSLTSFTSNYAQRNIIKFTDNTILDIKDEGYFDIENETLEKSKELFILPFEAGRNYRQRFVTSPLTVAEIPVWIKEIDEESNVTYNFQGSKPHLCEIATAISTTYAIHTEIQNFIVHYLKVAEMLDKYQLMEKEFYLNEQDIENYRSVSNGKPGAFIPVYISQLGGYFYINKIKNFVRGKLTKCEIIKL